MTEQVTSGPSAAEQVRSPLHERHAALGAKFAEFSGWSMPLEYAGGGVLAEHAAVRESVGVFDVSHLGKAVISGPGAATYANAMFTANLDRIGPGQAQYTMLCNAEGGVVDDLIAYLRSPEDVLCIPNAANTAQVVSILQSNAPEGVRVSNQHQDFAVIAVQGPASREVVTAAGFIAELDYMSFASDNGITICRTGYTGELGYELVIGSQLANTVWDDVMTAGAQHGIRPCGLGSRDTLRTEMGYALHGHEISPRISPVQAKLGWAVGWRKPAFPGLEALRQEKIDGPTRVACGLRALGRGIPRPGMSVVDAEGAEIGTITSGTFSPTLRLGIGLALIDPAHVQSKEVGVQIRNRVESFELAKLPLVPSHVKSD